MKFYLYTKSGEWKELPTDFNFSDYQQGYLSLSPFGVAGFVQLDETIVLPDPQANDMSLNIWTGANIPLIGGIKWKQNRVIDYGKVIQNNALSVYHQATTGRASVKWTNKRAVRRWLVDTLKIEKGNAEFLGSIIESIDDSRGTTKSKLPKVLTFISIILEYKDKAVFVVNKTGIGNWKNNVLGIEDQLIKEVENLVNKQSEIIEKPLKTVTKTQTGNTKEPVLINNPKNSQKTPILGLLLAITAATIISKT